MIYAARGSKAEVEEAVRQDLLSVARRVLAATNPPIRAVHDGTPRTYGGKFPALVLYRTVGDGRGRRAMLPAEIAAQVLVLHPAVAPRGSAKSGAAHADRETEAGMSAFLEALASDDDVRKRCLDVYLGELSSGAYNDVGTALFRDEADNVLWAQSAEVRFVL